MNKPFTFTCNNINNPIEDGAHMLKPILRKYFDEHGVNESTGKREKQMHAIALCHAIEYVILDYIDELEEFNS